MDNKKQLTVLVTGFGPFGRYTSNPSWEAVKLLPELFQNWEKSHNVNLIIEEIPVAYKHVSTKIKELLQQHKPDIVLHVGVSCTADCLTIETQATSTGYKSPDIFGECPKEEISDCVTLKTNCDVQKICEILNEQSHEVNCKAKISDDAGRYLCEYIYYQSLALKMPQVLFIHVPETHTYTHKQTAHGLLKILICLIECAIANECNEK